MNSKVGLHKKVAAIFDGVPAPGRSNPAGDAGTAEDPQTYCPAPSETRSGQSESSFGPAPVPVPAPGRSAGSAALSGKPAKPRLAHKSAGKKGTKDTKQLKMLIGVAILAVIFAGVLFLNLSSAGKSPAKIQNPAENPDAPAQAPAAVKNSAVWTRPDPLPENTRDPMHFAACSSDPANPDSSAVAVKGIVFSDARPSAIIGDQIVCEGDTLNGVTIVKIGKEHVEFKKDDKTWTQQVQR